MKKTLPITTSAQRQVQDFGAATELGNIVTAALTA
jgi:hypothetical protein